MNDEGFPDHWARELSNKQCVDGKNIRRCTFSFDRIKELDRRNYRSNVLMTGVPNPRSNQGSRTIMHNSIWFSPYWRPRDSRD